MPNHEQSKECETARQAYARDLQSWARGAPGVTNRHSTKMYRAMLRMLDELPARELDADGIVWLWSDLHLGHENIIRYASRPFADATEMDETLYANWGNRVGENDTLVVVGDLAMRRAVCEETWARVRAGVGKVKHLVVGNHDLTGSGVLRVGGFDVVSSLLVVRGDPPLLLTHLPLASLPKGWVNLHGHTHDDPPRRSPHINLSVEQLDYSPVALDRVRLLARELVAGRVPEGATTLEQLERIGA